MSSHGNELLFAPRRKLFNALDADFNLNHLEYANKLSPEDAADIYTPFSAVSKYEVMPYLFTKAAELKGGEDAFVFQLSELAQKYRGRALSYKAFLEFMGLGKGDLSIE